MDVKAVFCIITIAAVIISADSGVVFNFHEKLRMATTTEKNVQSSQIIRVPDLECPDNYRRDQLRKCRQQI